MSAQNRDDLVARYLAWFSGQLVLDEVGGYSELTTPFLDHHNDHIQVFALPTPDGVRLTDDGHTLTELENSGVDYSTTQRAEILDTILNGFGVSRSDDDALVVFANEENVGQRIHDLVQAVIAVDDMYVLASSRVRSLFFEDVEGFLIDSAVPFRPREKVMGKSGFVQRVNFFCPAFGDLPARMLQAIGSPTKQVVEREIFMMDDVRSVFSAEIRPYALLNDQVEPVPEESLHAFEEYNIRVEPWSRRENIRVELAGAPN